MSNIINKQLNIEIFLEIDNQYFETSTSKQFSPESIIDVTSYWEDGVLRLDSYPNVGGEIGCNDWSWADYCCVQFVL